MDARKDFVTEDVCCGVGHAGDLIYTFGIASMWENAWEAPVSNYIINQVSSSICRGIFGTATFMTSLILVLSLVLGLVLGLVLRLFLGLIIGLELGLVTS